ncbi:MAG: hypothetical protein PWQ91_1299 [Eubacteriales bacterium]|nr:hypothetical protein [Eubacteriales bacterium]MDN5364237.1 hypothetical protein [Eubacteriales bacterium]
MRAGKRSRRWIWPLTDNCGLTLVEVLAAVAILSIAIIPLLGLINSSVAKSYTVERRLGAQNLAIQEIESLLQQYADEEKIICPNGPVEKVDNQTLNGVAYTIRVRLEPVAQTQGGKGKSGASDLVKATVTVSWEDGGQTKQVVYTTLLTGVNSQ